MRAFSHAAPRNDRGGAGTWFLGVLAAFVGVTALAGGIELLLADATSPYIPPASEMLRYTPFGDYVVPGLLLAGVVGLSNLAAAVALVRRSRVDLDVAFLGAGAILVWIVAELAMLRTFHWLHGIYVALAVVQFAGVARAMLTSANPRHRWMVLVVLGEAVGFMIPGAVGVATSQLGLDALQPALLVAAGAGEGAMLGLGQAYAWPRPVPRGAYVAWTAAGAAGAWLLAMVLVGFGSIPQVPWQGVLAMGLVGGPLALVGMGAAQWRALRMAAPAQHAWTWIAWTALAWTLALPMSFLPSPFVDASTPWAVHVTLWACAGLIMAYVMALVTWQGVRRVTAPR